MDILVVKLILFVNLCVQILPENYSFILDIEKYHFALALCV